MNDRILAIGLFGLGLWGCSRAVLEPAATAPLAELAPASVAEPAPAKARAPLAYHDESERDRVFIENAERAIREYREFIARAGDRQEYAAAVKRSREQIDDLQSTLVFVREGSTPRVER